MDKPNMFCVIGIRHNPQLGSYLSKVKLAEKIRMNKCSISAIFTDFGEPATLSFSQTAAIDGVHYCKTKQNCIYGGYTYIGFSDKDKAIAELEKWVNKNGSSAERAKAGIEQLKAIN